MPIIAPPLLRLQDVTKVFPSGVTALTSLNLEVRPGEFLSLLGPSGCGKSTILRIIAGLTRPTRGEVLWSDPSTQDHRGEIGFVFQEPTLMPWANVEENVWLPLRLRGISRHDAMPHIEESLALVGLGAFARAYPRELSGGMKMRVSIARALSLKPRLLLMDEPFAALDEMTRFRLNDDLLRLQRELGCTVVFVTHSVYESAYLSHRIAIMTPLPGRIAVEIEGTSRRDQDLNFRASSHYADVCRRISGVLAGLTDEERV